MTTRTTTEAAKGERDANSYGARWNPPGERGSPAWIAYDRAYRSASQGYAAGSGSFPRQRLTGEEEGDAVFMRAYRAARTAQAEHERDLDHEARYG